MAGVHGKSGKLTIGVSGVVAGVTNWSQSIKSDTVEVGAMTEGDDKQYVAGRRETTYDVQFNYDSADADGQDMRIGRTFERREIKLETFFGVLFILQTPAGDGRQRRHTEIALLILEMFITAKDFRPFAVGIFRNDNASDDGARQIVGRSFWHDVGHQKLLLAVLREIAEYQHLGFAP